MFFMARLFAISFLLLGSLYALGQGPPPLNVYTSPDGGFSFAYPETYELLVGERISKATQGRHVGIPVCDFSTALVCVIYPIERLENTRFEAAGFSVNGVPSATTERDCVEYTDRTAPSQGEPLSISSLSINGRMFRDVSATVTIAGHSQSAHLYRSFQKQHCYELRIAISLSELLPAPSLPAWKALENADADKVRGSLRLILSSFRFLQ